MSFSVTLLHTTTVSNDDLEAAMLRQSKVPPEVIAYVKAGVATFQDGTVVRIAVYGHARGAEGDGNPHTASIDVRPA